MDRTRELCEFPLSSTYRDTGLRPARAQLRLVQERIGAVSVPERFRELPDPFEPLELLTRLGYRLDAFTQEEIILLAPPR